MKFIKILSFSYSLALALTLNLFAQEKKETTFVEEEGKIYKERNYLGVVPRIRDIPEIDSKKIKPKKDSIMWIGFQPYKLFSRVFIQLSGKPSFSISKEGDNKIIVEFIDTAINLKNDAREIITSEFKTSIEKITTKIIRSRKELKTIVAINLKKSAQYEYKQEGEYLFIDVEI